MRKQYIAYLHQNRETADYLNRQHKLEMEVDTETGETFIL